MPIVRENGALPETDCTDSAGLNFEKTIFPLASLTSTHEAAPKERRIGEDAAASGEDRGTGDDAGAGMDTAAAAGAETGAAAGAETGSAAGFTAGLKTDFTAGLKAGFVASGKGFGVSPM